MSGLSLSLSGVEQVFRVASIGDTSVFTFTTSEFAHLSVIFEGFCSFALAGRSETTSDRMHVLLQPESMRQGKLSPLIVILIYFKEDGAKLMYLHVSDGNSHSSLLIRARM